MPLDFVAVGRLLIETAKLLSRAAVGKKNSPPFEVLSNEEAIAHHLKFVESWSADVQVRQYARALPLDRLFVRLHLVEGEVRYGADPQSEKITLEGHELLRSGKHALVLGEPGAGKTTLVKHLCQLLLKSEPVSDSDEFDFPLLLPLRALPEDESIVERLLACLGITVRLSGASNAEDQRFLKQHRLYLLQKLLSDHRIAVLLDGLDEVGYEHGEALVRQLSELTHFVDKSVIIITCRFNALTATIESTTAFAIKPLKPEDVNEFVRRWFENENTAERFRKTLDRNPTYRALARTPLHIANLCLVFESKKRLPKSRLRVYETIVMLRLEQWDKDRNIRRESRYADFEADEKRRFLAALSFHMWSTRAGAQFDRFQLGSAFLQLHPQFGLPESEMDFVLSEIESHTGLVIQSGEDQFQFYHQSIYEYLCGDHLSRSQVDCLGYSVVSKMPDAAAIATGLAGARDSFLMKVWEVMWKQSRSGAALVSHVDFGNRYVSRLITDGVVVPPTPRAALGVVMMADACWEVNRVNPGASLLAKGGQEAQVRIAAMCNPRAPWADAIVEILERFDRSEVHRRFVVLRARAGKGDGMWLPDLCVVDRALLGQLMNGEEAEETDGKDGDNGER